jgi:hypothetical protein
MTILEYVQKSPLTELWMPPLKFLELWKEVCRQIEPRPWQAISPMVFDSLLNKKEFAFEFVTQDGWVKKVIKLAVPK